MAALKQTLQTTPYPTDLAALSKALDAQAPGQFDSDILGAARQQLSVAVQGQLGTLDVGPLFQILTDAAAKGVDVSADIQQYESRWPYYASITLAKLPDGSGVPNLIQMAQSSAGSTLNPAAESLAELAPQYPQAANTLIDMAKANQLPDSVVVRLAQFLGGREYQIGQETTQPLMGMQGFHVSDGNQDFASTEIANLSAEQIAQRLAIVNQLLAAIPADSRGSRAALQQQQVILNARLGKLSK
jgi:hypothetical protein